jgi:CubicO group peptidase (beta-lactamase class C family)
MLDLMPRAAAALGRLDAASPLEAVLADRDAVAARAVARLGLDARALVAAAGETDQELDRLWWMRCASDEAQRRRHGYIGTEHLLLGLLHAEPVAGALTALGSSGRALRGQVHRILCDGSPGGEWQAADPGRPPDEPMPAPHSALAAIAAEEPVAGLSWAETGKGQLIRTATYGWADPLRGVPVTADTRFRAGSVTKIATALLMLRLRDRGLVDLDEPASEKLRSVRLLDRDGAASTATVRQLLTHTAGLPRGSGLRHYAGPVPAPAELFASGIRADRPAGQWSYSNLGFVALGALAADLLGTPFGECLQDWVLGPLGLAESASLQELPPDTPVAHGHAFDAGLAFAVRPSAVLALGAGDLVASARDVAAPAAAIVNGRLLPAESAREMLVPHARCGPDTWQGLGPQVEYHGPVRLVGHGGSFPGYDAAAYACPETRQAAALLANTNTSLLKGQVCAALAPGCPAPFPQS